MRIHFYKYQGTGNDFVLVDQRSGVVNYTQAQIARICDRRFGVGGDGFMMLRSVPGFDFRMVYYNSDGRESTMCGNGGRCMVAFARHLGIIAGSADFVAIDGVHSARILDDLSICLQMNDVDKMEHYHGHSVLNTGSPHFVKWVQDTADYPVVQEGREIRNRSEFQPGGINVNFVQKTASGLFVRTYERGVEDETLSCGTGVTAAAIASTGPYTGIFEVRVNTPGGALRVDFEKNESGVAKNVRLTGPAKLVFEGDLDIEA